MAGLGQLLSGLSTNAISISSAGSVLLFGIGTKALPLWDQEDGGGSIYCASLPPDLAAGTSLSANSPHPSSLRRTSLHRLVKLNFSPSAYCCWLSCRITDHAKEFFVRFDTDWAKAAVHSRGLEPPSLTRSGHARNNWNLSPPRGQGYHPRHKTLPDYWIIRMMRLLWRASASRGPESSDIGASGRQSRRRTH